MDEAKRLREQIKKLKDTFQKVTTAVKEVKKEKERGKKG